MNIYKRLGYIILSLFLCASMNAQPAPGSFRQTWKKGPEWVKNAVIYQIYPSSYKDSDGNGIGDIPGVISKLDYIHSLGVTAIWFNPLFESGWIDGGYDVIDYYKVDPRFGTNNDLVKLIEEAHKRGIKVLLDLIPGHTSDKHPWFLQSSEDTNLRYSDYFIWSDRLPDAKAEKDLEEMLKMPNFMQSTKGKWMKSEYPRDKYYYKNFYACQPALNFGFANPDPSRPWEQSVNAPGPRAVKRELMNIIAFWYDKGVDGFRVDMAGSLVKNDKDYAETINFWREIREWSDAHYPDHVLMAEWSDPKYCLASGLNIDMCLNRTKTPIRHMFLDRKHQADGGAYFSIGGYKPSVKDLYGNPWPENEINHNVNAASALKEYYDHLTDAVAWTKDWGYYAHITGNHDHLRINTGSRNDPDQLRVLLSWIMTTQLPVLYYGDEIGMRSLVDMPNAEGANHDGKERSGARTPMQWDGSVNAGFSDCDPDDIYLPVCPDWTPAYTYPAYLAWKQAGSKNPTSNGAPTVASQENDSNSLLNWTRRLIELRKSTPAFWADAEMTPIFNEEHPYPMVYTRSDGNETWIVALNPTGKNQTVTLPASLNADKGQVQPYISHGKATIKGSTLKMGATSIFIGRLPESETAITVCSFNIRYANNKGDTFVDGTSAAWEDRRDAVKAFIETVKPDIIGMQEIRKVQSEDINSFFKDEYAFYDVGRDGEHGLSVSEGTGEGVGIMYRKERFELVEKDFFWLDKDMKKRPVKNEDGSYGDWHSACRRLTVHVVLRDKKHNNSHIHFYSTHFDHKNKDAIRNSSILLAEKVKNTKSADAVIVVGDLNAKVEDGNLQPLMESCFYARNDAPGSDLYIGTFNGFGKRDSIIDHIFYTGKVLPVKYWVNKNGYGLPMISDHHPVLFRFDYK